MINSLSEERDVEDKLFDVIATNIETGKERIISSGKTERNAEAILEMAVMRRGVDEEFFKTVPHSEDLNPTK